MAAQHLLCSLPAWDDEPRLQAWLGEVQALTHEDAQRVRQWLEVAMSLLPFPGREEMVLPPDEQPAPCLQTPAPAPLLADTPEFDEAVARAVKRAQRRGFL